MAFVLIPLLGFWFWGFFLFIITVEIAVKTPGKLISNITWDGTPPDRAQHGMVVATTKQRCRMRDIYSLKQCRIKGKFDGKFMRYWASRCPRIEGLPKPISYMEKSEAV